MNTGIGIKGRTVQIGMIAAALAAGGRAWAGNPAEPGVSGSGVPLPSAIGSGLAGMSASGREAMGALSEGLASGASHEDSSRAGFRAERALLGGGASRGVAAPVSGNSGASEGQAPEFPAAAPAKKEPGAVPAPGAKAAANREGFFAGLSRKAGEIKEKAAGSFSGMSRAKKIALLSGLLAVEVAVLLHPLQAVQVVVMGLGVLGIVGTTRELVAAFRRRGA